MWGSSGSGVVKAIVEGSRGTCGQAVIFEFEILMFLNCPHCGSTYSYEQAHEQARNQKDCFTVTVERQMSLFRIQYPDESFKWCFDAFSMATVQHTDTHTHTHWRTNTHTHTHAYTHMNHLVKSVVPGQPTRWRCHGLPTGVG